VTAVGKDALWRDSDIVSIHLPLNTQTRGSVGEEELARMKATAILVNTARA
jgi:lactate dehydrogenase-like 2-hydroxyacid dehydrogenase